MEDFINCNRLYKSAQRGQPMSESVSLQEYIDDLREDLFTLLLRVKNKDYTQVEGVLTESLECLKEMSLGDWITVNPNDED